MASRVARLFSAAGAQSRGSRGFDTGTACQARLSRWQRVGLAGSLYLPDGVQSAGRSRAALSGADAVSGNGRRSEEHTSELQSLMRISYAGLCLKKQITTQKYK